MRISKIYQAVDFEPGKTLKLDERATHYLLHVLRVKPNDELQLFDGKGHFADAVVAVCNRKEIVVNVQTVAEKNNESPLQIHLYQGYCRGEKMDLVMQKATELGVSHITPLITQRCQMQPDAKRQQNRLQHWQQVMISACEQSGRSHLPTLHPFIKLDDYSVTSHSLILQPDSATNLSEYAVIEGQVDILIGPEGGFSEDELSHLLNRDCQCVALGQRVLRSETAGLAAISVLQALAGDF